VWASYHLAALRKRSEERVWRGHPAHDAMQLLSDEEFTIIRVRDECQNQHMVMLKEKDLVSTTGSSPLRQRESWKSRAIC